MLKVVIIEDEPIAAQDLEKTLIRVAEDAEVIAKLDSVTNAIQWLSENECDLILSDIQLGDGLSFDIFRNLDLNTPIIITTAFDEYALRAFKENSIDYLLKPIDTDELKKAIEKYRFWKKDNIDFDLGTMIESLRPRDQSYQERFIVTLGERIQSIAESQVAYFFSEDRYTYLVDHNGKQQILNSNLGDLEKTLNPKKFYRINRKFIICFEAIKSMIAYSKSRVKIDLVPEPPNSLDVIVSVERSGAFKKWLNR
ncbi:MAG: two-component system response regulator LytT [Cyclobacteriaceae bacterium]|jgi:two-component system response regulator LytT